MPFTPAEILSGIDGIGGASGAGDPYGLGKHKAEDYSDDSDEDSKYWTETD